MHEMAIKPLPADPLAWTDVDMWGWVNEVSPLVDSGVWVNGRKIEVLEPSGRLRPVLVKFARPSLVETKGYSWQNHISDEMVAIEFLPDQIVLSVIFDLNSVLLARLITVVAMVRMADRIMPRNRTGIAPMSIGDGDWGRTCLAFASQQSVRWLVPDPYFLLTCGYVKERHEIAQTAKPWSERKDQIYWRGAPSGLEKYEDHSLSQRVQLVLRAGNSDRSELFDVRFAGLQGMDDAVAEAVRAVRGDGPREPQMTILEYKFNVDVDGWSCAWTGFFIKLLAGAPVFKVMSDRGFRQWYYNALQPWHHHVPIAADLSDLEWSSSVLEARPDWAEEIGARGKALAESMNFENQIERAGVTIAEFLETLA